MRHATQLDIFGYAQDSFASPKVKPQRVDGGQVEKTIPMVAPRKRRASKKKEQVVLPPEAVAYLEAASRLEAFYAKPDYLKPNDYGFEAATLFAIKREADARVRATHGGENPYNKG